jgi:exopolysaccharide biosynthesis operon protein EpsL
MEVLVRLARGRPGRTHALLAICCALGVSSPWRAADAMDGDRLQLRVSTTLTHDDNLYRQSNNYRQGSAVIGDRILTDQVGVRLDVPYSRQRFLVDLSAAQNRFARSSALDNTGENALGEWDWGVGNDWSGSVQAIQNRALSNLAYVSFNTRNIYTQRNLTASADYLLDARYRLQGQLGTGSVTNSDVLKFNDTRQRFAQLGIQYLTPSGNALGVRTRIEDDTLPNNTALLVERVDNSYRDAILESYFDWRTSGVSRFSGHLGITHRGYNEFTDRNFNGVTGRVQYDWTPNDVSAMTAGLERTLYGILDLQSQFVITHGLDLKATWIPSPKITAQAGVYYSKSDFGGDAVTVSLQGAQRRDSNRGMNIGVNYDIRRWARLGLNYQYSERTSSLQFADYVDHTVSLSAQLNF